MIKSLASKISRIVLCTYTVQYMYGKVWSMHCTMYEIEKCLLRRRCRSCNPCAVHTKPSCLHHAAVC